MADSLPLVSIISVNYNGAEVTCQMIVSLKKITYPNIEIIIVDNASKESPQKIKDLFPEIILIESKTNLGFAGGNNLGLQVAKGKYLFLLNNDTEVAPDFLEPLVEKMESSEWVGAVSPKVYYFGTKILQYAGATPIHPITGRGGFIGDKLEDKGQYNTPLVSNHTHGAAMLVPRKVLEQVGLMSEFFFLYYEELDFCEKIKRAGYTIWYIPTSIVYHKESMAVGKQSPLKMFYMTRNRILFMRRNVSLDKFLLFLLFFMAVSVPKNSLTFLIKREWKLLGAFWKGIIWHLAPRKVPNDPELSLS